MPLTARALSSLLSLALVGGCATSTPKDQFPARDEVTALLAEAAPTVESKPAFVSEQWELMGPLPDRGGDVPFTPSDPIGTRLKQLAPGDSVLTEGMACAAREVANIVVRGDGKLPSQPLYRFVLGACGNLVAHASLQTLSGTVGEESDEAAVLAQWSDDIDRVLKQAPSRHVVGAALAVHGGRASLVLAFVRPQVLVEPFSLAPQGDRVTVRGEVLEPTVVVRAMVNRGLYGFGRCELDPQVRAPKFSATCQVTTDDETAWMGLTAFPPERYIGHGVLSVLFRPNGKAPTHYRAPAYTASGPRLDTAPAFAADFVERINAVRKQAGAGALTLAVEQSATASGLAAHMAAAAHNRDEVRSERLLMSMLAGWDVTEPITNGDAAWFSAQQSEDMADLISTALGWPETRATLLDPAYDLVAIGPERLDKPDTLLLVGTWDRFDGHSIEADTAAAWASLRAERREGLPVPGVMPLIDARAAELAAAVDDGATAEDAMGDLLQAAVNRYQHGMSAWRLYPRTLDDIAWPRELLETPQIYVSMSVAVEQHPALAWRREVILVVAHLPKGSVITLDEDGPPTEAVVSR